jgi:hypothetical protein
MAPVAIRLGRPGLRRPPSPNKESTMLFTVAIILFVLWALGLVSGYALGGLIHLFLVVALVMLVLQFLSGRRAV